MTYDSSFDSSNTFTIFDVMKWLEENKKIENYFLNNIMKAYLQNREELVEDYVENNIDLRTAKKWLKIMTEDSRVDDEYPNLTRTWEDIFDCIKNGNCKILLRKFGFILQEILKTKDVTVKISENLLERTLSSCKLILTKNNGSIKISLSLKNIGCNAVIKIGKGDKDKLNPFAESEFFIVKFVSDCLTTCFSLYESSSELEDRITKTLFYHLRRVMINKDLIKSTIPKILTQVRSFLSADRVNMFSYNESMNELVAEFFDLGNVFVKSHITCQMGKGYCGSSAQSRKLLNVSDCSSFRKSSSEVLKMVDDEIECIMCCPITSGRKLFGVLQSLKFFGPPFGDTDETIIRCMASYCSFMLHLDYLRDLRNSKENYLSVLSDILRNRIFNKNKEDINRLIIEPHPALIPDDIDSIDFDYTKLSEQHIPKLFIHLCNDLLGKDTYPFEKLCNFIVTVSSYYRKVPFHNILHAFNVTHCMYLVIKNNRNIFSVIEIKAMIIACICHDLDHRGFTNSYYITTKSPLATLYRRSVLERHHFDVAMFILQENRNNIFCDLNKPNFAFVVSSIESLIMATDLASLLPHRNELEYFVKRTDVKIPEAWFNLDNRTRLKMVMMSGCDLSGLCKPWKSLVFLLRNLYEEFYHQGDKEKESGLHPDSMMDRSLIENIPEDQKKFVTYICMPVYELLAICLPNTKPILDGCKRTLRYWESFNGKVSVLMEETDKKPERVYSNNR